MSASRTGAPASRRCVSRTCGRDTSHGPRSSWPGSPNVYLIRDPSLGAGYQLKLIDMDFSVLADHRAPWHGYQGYVGSDNYRSPEHLTRGAMPGLASDVFTCGLILYELTPRMRTHPAVPTILCAAVGVGCFAASLVVASGLSP